MKPNSVIVAYNRFLDQVVRNTNDPKAVNEECNIRDRKASLTAVRGNRQAAPAGKTPISNLNPLKRERTTTVSTVVEIAAEEEEKEASEKEASRPRARKRSAPSGNRWSDGKTRGEFAMINIDSKDLEAASGRLVGRRGQLARAKAGEIGYGGDPNPAVNNFGYFPFSTEAKSAAKKRAAPASPKGSTVKRAKGNLKVIESRGDGGGRDGHEVS